MGSDMLRPWSKHGHFGNQHTQQEGNWKQAGPHQIIQTFGRRNTACPISLGCWWEKENDSLLVRSLHVLSRVTGFHWVPLISFHHPQISVPWVPVPHNPELEYAKWKCHKGRKTPDCLLLEESGYLWSREVTSTVINNSIARWVLFCIICSYLKFVRACPCPAVRTQCML